ncbi:MAG: TadE/TadG family type IV pilus assembly protein [Ahrensia sp.]|nr:TadE/TadG family type IV pilus assembly protein [Ahrensia sp.]
MNKKIENFSSMQTADVIKQNSARLKKSVCAFDKSKRGSLAVNFALLLFPLMAAVGFGIDGSRMLLSKFELQAALDASALAMGATYTDADTLKNIVEKFVDKNFQVNGATVTDVTASEENGEVIVSATADLELFFGGFLGKTYSQVAASTQVKRAGGGLLATLVIDNTGSMWSSNNIGALRDANLELIRNAFNAKKVGGTWTVAAAPNDLRMSIVPYSAAVNVGDEFLNIINPNDVRDIYENTLLISENDVDNIDDEDLRSDTQLNRWKGCVVERENYARSDVAPNPSNPATMWKPFWYPHGIDNNYNPTNVSTIKPGGLRNSNQITGPNVGCPTPIVPLTNDFSKLNAAATAITAWNRGGTLTDIGLAWGYRTLSPGLPFTQSTEVDPRFGEQMWSSSRWRKSIILMTDGDSLFYDLPALASRDRGKPDYPNDAHPGKSDYTGYERLGDDLADEIFETDNASTARNYINTAIASMCTDYKSQGIIVYTVVFTSGVSQATRDMYSACASDPGKYWYAPNSNALKNAFGKIGSDLAKLRIIQ